jgi:hypothetical protein
VAVLRAAAERGEIARELDFEQAVNVLLALGDGVEVRRVSDPDFNPESVMPAILDIVRYMLLNPVGAPRHDGGRE